MAWNPLQSMPTPQIDSADNTPLNGWWLIAFEAGTTTPVNMAIDSSGSGQALKFEINSRGFFQTTGAAVIVPFVDRAVKLAIVPTESEADAGDTSNALWPTVDNIKGLLTTDGAEIWVAFSGAPTRTGNDTFTVTGDQTATFPAGTRLRLTDSSTLYGTVESSVFTSLTTVTVELDSGNLSASLTAVETSIIKTTEKPVSSQAISVNLGFTGTDINKSLNEMFLDLPISVLGAGAVLNNSDDITTPVQNVIDALNVTYLGGTFGGRGGVCYIPKGIGKVTGLVIKKGVSIIGDGQANTVLLISQDGGTLLKTPAKASQAAGDVVAQSVIKGMTFGVHSSLTPTVSTILLDSSGLTKCILNDLTFECPSNVIGSDNTGNTLAGSGGPAHWYNTWIHPFFNVSGGIGIRWGDSDVATEQVTAQTVIGGRIGGTSGTGMHIRGGTGNNFHGTSFEGLNGGSDNTIIFGDASGSRVTTSNNFHGCYLEQVKVTYNANTNRNRRYGGLETSVTEVDNGNRNGRVDHEQLYRGWPRVYVSGRVTAPTTINKSYNVDTGTGITRVSAGVFEVPFDITMPDVNYIALATAETDNLTGRTSTKTTTTVRFIFFDDTGTAADPTSFTFTITDNDA